MIVVTKDGVYLLLFRLRRLCGCATVAPKVRESRTFIVELSLAGAWRAFARYGLRRCPSPFVDQNRVTRLVTDHTISDPSRRTAVDGYPQSNSGHGGMDSMPDTNEDQPQIPGSAIPRKRARVETSIPPKQKIKLIKLDSGRCLLTGESEDSCIDACYILPRKTFETEVGN